MAQQQSQPEDAGTGTEETSTPAEGDETSATGTETTEAGAPAGDAGAEKPAEEQPEELTEEQKAAKEKEATEWEVKVKAAAEKYAKDLVTQANRTMAAARRAEKAAKEAAAPLQAELQTAKHEAKIYGDFVRELQTAPMSALKKLGFATVKSFLDHVVESGGEREQTEEERIASLVTKEIEKRDAPRKDQERAAAIAEAKRLAFAHIDAQTERFDLVTTDIGHDRLWKNIEAYHAKHGVVPDAAIDLIADKVEKELAESLGKSKKFGLRQPGNNGASGAAPAAGASSTSGKSLAGKPTSGAPAVRKYPVTDPDALERAINEDMRAHNEI